MACPVDCNLGQFFRGQEYDVVLNSDIVGWGSFAAFVASASAVVLVVLFAYATDTLPIGDVSGIDYIIVKPFRHQPRTHEVGMSKAAKREFTGKLLLALSDQQLVTGLAALVGGVSDRSITQWEFGVVVALAWFSALTQLTSLLVLENYFRRNRLVAILRIIFMLATLGLLIYGLIIMTFSTASLDSVECVLCRNYQASTVSIVSGIVLSLYMIFGFVDRILTILHMPGSPKTRYDHKDSVGNALAESGTSRIYHDIYDEIPKHSFARAIIRSYLWVHYGRKPDKGYDFVHHFLRIQVHRHLKHQEQLLEALNKPSWRRYINWPCFKYFVNSVTASFAFQLPFLSFGFCFGFTQVINTQLAGPYYDPRVTRVDYGQVITLLLLLLPIMTGIELYEEAFRPGFREEPTAPSPAVSGGTHPDQQTNVSLSQYRHRKAMIFNMTFGSRHGTALTLTMLAVSMVSFGGLGIAIPFIIGWGNRSELVRKDAWVGALVVGAVALFAPFVVATYHMVSNVRSLRSAEKVSGSGGPIFDTARSLDLPGLQRVPVVHIPPTPATPGPFGEIDSGSYFAAR